MERVAPGVESAHAVVAVWAWGMSTGSLRCVGGQPDAEAGQARGHGAAENTAHATCRWGGRGQRTQVFSLRPLLPIRL